MFCVIFYLYLKIYGRREIKKNAGITSKPSRIDVDISITIPTKNGPKIAHIFPKIEKSKKADN